MELRAGVALLLVLLLVGCVTHSGTPAALTQRANADFPFAVARALSYRTAVEDAPRADLYRPVADAPLPAVVLLHGGGWVRGEREQMAGIAEAAARHGYAVLNIDYRLAPAHPYPAALEDVRAAIAWLRTQPDIDPQRIALWGYSAGAHLAALAGTQEAPAGARVQAVVAGGIPADLVHAARSTLVQKFMGAPLPEIPERYRDASPLHQVSADDAPTFLYHGTWDWVVWPGYARQMKAALDAAGVPAELYLMHGFGHFAAFMFDAGAVRAALAFLDRQMPPPPQPAAMRSSWPQTQAP